MNTVTVDAVALRQVLEAFATGQSHRVLELLFTQIIPDNPIEKLASEFNAAVEAHNVTLQKEPE